MARTIAVGFGRHLRLADPTRPGTNRLTWPSDLRPRPRSSGPPRPAGRGPPGVPCRRRRTPAARAGWRGSAAGPSTSSTCSRQASPSRSPRTSGMPRVEPLEGPEGAIAGFGAAAGEQSLEGVDAVGVIEHAERRQGGRAGAAQIAGGLGQMAGGHRLAEIGQGLGGGEPDLGVVALERLCEAPGWRPSRLPRAAGRRPALSPDRRAGGRAVGSGHAGPRRARPPPRTAPPGCSGADCAGRVTAPRVR